MAAAVVVPEGTVEALGGRGLLSTLDARELAETFALLASDTRLRVLHALARAGELCVKDLAVQVGMRAPAVCNQLQRLEDRGVVRSRRAGNFVYYRVDDPCVLQLIELGACLTLDAAKAAADANSAVGAGCAR